MITARICSPESKWMFLKRNSERNFRNRAWWFRFDRAQRIYIGDDPVNIPSWSKVSRADAHPQGDAVYLRCDKTFPSLVPLVVDPCASPAPNISVSRSHSKTLRTKTSFLYPHSGRQSEEALCVARVSHDSRPVARRILSRIVAHLGGPVRQCRHGWLVGKLWVLPRFRK